MTERVFAVESTVFLDAISYTKFKKEVDVSGVSLGSEGNININCEKIAKHSLVRNSKEAEAMLWNTYVINNVISCTENDLNLILPEGTFYFVSGGSKEIIDSNYGGDYVVYLRDNLTIAGQGTSDRVTILVPYSSTGDRAVDMFAYNGFKADATEPNPLNKAIFLNFIIDGENVGDKGFEINAVNATTWNNVIVRNMRGIGFDIGAPNDVEINNSSAVSCGISGGNKENSSGFVIRNGYKSTETATIANSYALENKGYGFFFGHQSRYNAERYNGESVTRDAFRLIDSEAIGNGVNYGGDRANDVYIKNVMSDKGGDGTILGAYFDDQSRNIVVDNLNIKGDPFDDITDPGAYYYDAVKWGAETGVIVGKGDRQFAPNDTVVRGDAVIIMWRYKGRSGNVLSIRNGLLDNNSNEVANVETCFGDVSKDAYYARAIRWGYEKRLIIGTETCTSENSEDGKFEPTKNMTLAEVLTLLMRLDKMNSGIVLEEIENSNDGRWYDSAIEWAKKKGILDNISVDDPDRDCTRAEFITLLWRTVDRPKSTSLSVETDNSNKYGKARGGRGNYYIEFDCVLIECPFTEKIVEVGRGQTITDRYDQYVNPLKDKGLVEGYVFNGWLTDEGKEFDWNGPVESNMELYASWVPMVNYSKDEHAGRWHFINDPETFSSGYFVNEKGGKALYSGSLVRGMNELYWEHNRPAEETREYYYGIRVYNPTRQKDVKLTIERCGSAATKEEEGYDPANTWAQYYQDQIKYEKECTVKENGKPTNSITITGGTSKFIFQNSDDGFRVSAAIDEENNEDENNKINTMTHNNYGGPWDGVLKIDSDGEVDFQVVAFRECTDDEQKEGICSKPNSENIGGDPYPYYGNYIESGWQYSGYREGLPRIKNEMVYRIYDWMPVNEPLLVAYETNQGKTVVGDSWDTNMPGASLGANCKVKENDNTFIQDLIGLILPVGGDMNETVEMHPEQSGKYDTRHTTNWSVNCGDIYGANWNWANWAVHYDENIEIKNETRDPIYAMLKVSNQPGETIWEQSGQNVFMKCDSGFSTLSKVENPAEIECGVMVEAGKSKKIPAVVILGGMSSGRITKKLYYAKKFQR